MTLEQARAIAAKVMDDARNGDLLDLTPERTEELIAAALLAAVSATARQLVAAGEITLVIPEQTTSDEETARLKDAYLRGYRDGTLSARGER